jgi:hypothetical protein
MKSLYQAVETITRRKRPVGRPRIRREENISVRGYGRGSVGSAKLTKFKLS